MGSPNQKKSGVPAISQEHKRDLVRFAGVGFLAFLIVIFNYSYREGKGLILKNQEVALRGFAELEEGIQALKERHFANAQERFTAAEQSIATLLGTFQKLKAQANPFLDQSLYLDTAEKLIETGLQVAQMGQQLMAEIEAIQKGQGLSFQTEAFFQELQRIRQPLKEWLSKILDLQANFTSLNADLLPSELQEKLQQGQQKISEFLTLLKSLNEAEEAALRFLGEKKPHHILLLLQNKNERRATGGFIGSVILLTFSQGEITKMEGKDVYEIDGQLQEKIKAPPGIEEVAEAWYLRDANYSPDFPTSAKKIMWFLEHSRGPTVDTVIALDQTVAEKILELAGPVEIPGFPFTLKAKNLDNLLSFYTEAKLSKTKTPKQLLFDLIPILKEELLKLRDVEAIFSAVRPLIEEGHIQLYSEDPEIQRFGETWKLDGKWPLPAPKTDMLTLVSTSIGGNKSDRFIQTDLGHETAISKEGRIRNQLTLTQRHTWQPREFLRWKRYFDYYREAQLQQKKLRFILGEGPHVDYVRVYVPQGSKLLGEAPPTLQVTEDLGYTVFAFKMTVKPGETQTITLEYELPFTLAFEPLDHYRLIVGHQAGAENINFKKTLALEKELEVTEEYPPRLRSGQAPQPYAISLNSNQIFFVALKLL